jgi:putative restriction endonuclease
MPTWSDFITTLKVWKRGPEVAVHKPLLLLFVLAQAKAGGSNRFAFKDLVLEFEKALRDFGPDRQALHPESPFWHLQDDDFWVIENKDELPVAEGASGPTKSALLKHAAVAVVPSVKWDALRADSRLLEGLVAGILAEYWPDPSTQAEIRRFFRLEVPPVAARSSPPDWRE